MTLSSEESNLLSSIDHQEIENILDHIDDYLDSPLGSGIDLGRIPLAPLPSIPPHGQIENDVEKIMLSSAPLRTSMGVGGFRGILLRALNLPVRIFLSEQILFNNHLRRICGGLYANITDLQPYLSSVRAHIDELTASQDKVNELQLRIADLVETNQYLNEKVEHLTAEIEEIKKQLLAPSQK